MQEIKNRPPEISREQARISLEITKLLGVKLNQFTAAKLFDGRSIIEVQNMRRTGKGISLDVVVRFDLNE